MLRKDIIELVPESAKRVIELGCMEGENLNGLKERGVTEYIGIDMTVPSNPENMSKFIAMDLDSDAMLDIKEGAYDVIIAADILEHLRYPIATINSFKKYLRPGGSFITSIPNIAHIDVIVKMMSSEFQYDPSGLLDRTHQRFWSQKSINAMFTSCGFKSEISNFNTAIYGHSNIAYRNVKKVKELIDKLSVLCTDTDKTFSFFRDNMFLAQFLNRWRMV